MKNLLLITLLCYCASTLAQPFQVEYFSEFKEVNSIEVIDGNVYAGTYLGLMKINKSNPQEMERIIDPFVDYKPGSCFSLNLEKRSDNVLFIHHFYDLFSYSGSSFNLELDSLLIYDTYADDNGAIWILNDKKEIIRNDHNGLTKISHENSNLPDYDYENICVENNVVWLGTFGKGIIRLENNTVTEINLPYNQIISIDINNGVLWALCFDFLFEQIRLMKYSDGIWTKYDATNSPFTGSFGGLLRCIDNKVFVINSGYLYQFDGSEWTSNYIGETVNCIALDQNDIWIGKNEGFSLIRDNQITNYNIENRPFTGTFEGPVIEDLDGAIWVGSNGSFGNLCKKTGDLWTEVIGQNYTNFNTYRSLAVDSNNVVWTLTFDCLYRVDEDSIIKFTQYNSVLRNTFLHIVVDKYNNKWINTSNQIVRFNDTAWTVYDISNYSTSGALSLATDHTGNIWMGIYQLGLVKFNGTTWTEYGNDIFNDDWPEIRNIIVDKEDNLWLDYTGRYIEPQICKFDGVNLEWFDDNINLPQKGSGLQAIDKYGNIWYGSTSGLAKYDWDRWTFYNEENTRLLNSTVNRFYIDSEENKWISSGCYLAKFNEDILYSEPEINSIKENSKFSIYPNPVNTNNLNINVNERLFTNTQVTIIDMLGQIRYQKELAVNSDFTIDISSLSSGLYVMRFIQNGRAEIHKFLKL